MLRSMAAKVLLPDWVTFGLSVQNSSTRVTFSSKFWDSIQRLNCCVQRNKISTSVPDQGNIIIIRKTERTLLDHVLVSSIFVQMFCGSFFSSSYAFLHKLVFWWSRLVNFLLNYIETMFPHHPRSYNSINIFKQHLYSPISDPSTFRRRFL